MVIQLEELKKRIVEKYDADEIVDLLRLTTEDIICAFPHRLAIYRDNFASEEYWEEESGTEEV